MGLKKVSKSGLNKLLYNLNVSLATPNNRWEVHRTPHKPGTIPGYKHGQWYGTHTGGSEEQARKSFDEGKHHLWHSVLRHNDKVMDEHNKSKAKLPEPHLRDDQFAEHQFSEAESRLSDAGSVAPPVLMQPETVTQHEEANRANPDDPRIQRSKFLKEHHSKDFAHGMYEGGNGLDTEKFHTLVGKHGGDSDSRGGFAVPHKNLAAFHKLAQEHGYSHGTHYHTY